MMSSSIAVAQNRTEPLALPVSGNRRREWGTQYDGSRGPSATGVGHLVRQEWGTGRTGAGDLAQLQVCRPVPSLDGLPEEEQGLEALGGHAHPRRHGGMAASRVKIQDLLDLTRPISIFSFPWVEERSTVHGTHSKPLPP